MNTDQLLAFNPILAEAWAKAERAEKHPETLEMFRQIVAAAVKVGADPQKIYAMIVTGRMLTQQNMQFLSEDDLQEWGNACAEYKRKAAKLGKRSKRKSP